MATYKKEFILSGGIGLSADRLFIVSATNSTTISTGSLILSGGAGIAQSLSIGGSLQIFNGSNFTFQSIFVLEQYIYSSKSISCNWDFSTTI